MASFKLSSSVSAALAAVVVGVSLTACGSSGTSSPSAAKPAATSQAPKATAAAPANSTALIRADLVRYSGDTVPTGSASADVMNMLNQNADYDYQALDSGSQPAKLFRAWGVKDTAVLASDLITAEITGTRSPQLSADIKKYNADLQKVCAAVSTPSSVYATLSAS